MNSRILSPLVLLTAAIASLSSSQLTGADEFEVFWNARMYPANQAYVEVTVDATRGPSNAQVVVSSFQITIVDSAGQKRDVQINFGPPNLGNRRYIKYFEHGVGNARSITPTKLTYSFAGAGGKADSKDYHASKGASFEEAGSQRLNTVKGEQTEGKAVVVAPPAQPKMGPLMNGRAYMGGTDYRSTHVSSATECSSICVREQQCVAMTFDSDIGTCWLKNGFTQMADSANMTSARKLGR